MGILVIALLGPRPGAAQTPKERAAALLKQGSALYDKGDYPAALQRFERAHALYPSYKIVYNIATTLEYMGRAAEAARRYAQFLRLAARSASLDMIRAARASLPKLARGVGRVELSCAQAGVTVLVDGRARGTTPLAQALYLPPGKRTLRLTREGLVPLERELTLRAGQLERLPVQLRRVAPPPATRPVTAAPAGEDAGARGRRRTRAIWRYTTLGVGLALTATAAALYGVGASQGGEAHDRYTEATARPGASLTEIDQHRADVEAARGKVLAGNVLLGAGLVALGASVYLWLTHPGGVDEARAGPLVVQGGGGLGLGGRF